MKIRIFIIFYIALLSNIFPNKTHGQNCIISGSLAGWVTQGLVQVVSSTGGVDYYGNFPLGSPGSGFAIKLGNSIQYPQPSSRASYTFTVSATEPFLLYHYAMVNLDYPHSTNDAATASLKIFDSQGNIIPCTSFEFFAAPGGPPGFTASPRQYEQNFGSECCYGISYLPWKTSIVDLRTLIGQNVTIEFNNDWCIYGVDWGYSYLDAQCADLKIQQGCQGQSVFLNAPSGGIAYLWNNGSTSQSIPVSSPGTYTCTITPAQGSSCNFDLTYVYTPSSSSIDFSFTSPCISNPVNFQSIGVSGGSNTQWSWDFGDGTSSTLQNPAHSYTIPGNYNISLEVTNSLGCRDTIVKSVTINPSPNANFSYSGFCPYTQTTFTNLSTSPNGPITNWEWTFGDGSLTSLTSNPTHTYSSNVAHTASLLITDSIGCKDTVQTIVAPFPLPVVSFNSTSQCEKTNVTCSNQTTINTGSIASYQWSFGDGSPLTNAVIGTHTYLQSGNFYITLSATSNNGCVDSLSLPITIFQNPTASFTSNSVCPNETCNFTDLTSSTITNWSWNFGDGSPTITGIQNPSHNYSNSGNYNATLIVTDNNGCIDTTQENVTINPLPLISFTVDSVCEGFNTHFNNSTTINNGTINKWSWIFGDNSIFQSPLMSPTHLYSTAGVYTSTLFATSDKGCIDSLSKNVRVWNNPVASFNAVDTVFCNDYDLILNDNSTSIDGLIYFWNWDFGNNETSNSQNPIYNYTNPGTYSVSLQVTTSLGCVDEKTYQNYIHIYPTPKSDFTYNPNNASVFQPEIHFYDLSDGANYWHWDFGDNNTSSNINPNHIYSQANNYIVTLIVENNLGCKDTTLKYIDIKNDYAIWIPNSFSPNNDGQNDFFFGKGFGFTNYELSIFDRWGEKIFVSNDQEIGWDGTCNGKESAIDVYVYQISIVDIFNEPHTYNGRVTLVR